MFTVRFEHDLTPTTTVRNITRYGKTTQDYLLTSFMGGGFPANGVLTAASPLRDAEPQRSFHLDDHAQLPTNKYQVNTIMVNQTSFVDQAGDGRGQALADRRPRVDPRRAAQRQLLRPGLRVRGRHHAGGAAAGSWPAANLYNPDPNVTGYNRIRNGTGSDGQTDTVAAYLFDTAQLNAQWQITGGVRVDHYSPRTTPPR
jgi:catecholate siderophore receptor